MSILDKFVVVNKKFRLPGYPGKLESYKTLESREKKEESIEQTIDFNYRTVYQLEVKLGVSFVANDETYTMALRNAERQVVQCIYGDILEDLYVISDRIINGYNSVEALEKCEELIERLRNTRI